MAKIGACLNTQHFRDGGNRDPYFGSGLLFSVRLNVRAQLYYIYTGDGFGIINWEYLFAFIIRYMMDKSDEATSSIAEEEQIAAIAFPEEVANPLRKKMQYAKISEINDFQAISQIHNKKFIDQNPTLFSRCGSNKQILHLVDTKTEQYLMIDGNKQGIQDMISKQDKRWQININLTNICKQSLLHLQISQIKRNHTFTIISCQTKENKPIGFKYTFNLFEESLVIKIWVSLNQVYKIWKEMEVPISQKTIILELCQLNNQQTNVKINDYIFHLILKMPLYQYAHYHLIHQNSVDISKLQYKTKAEQKYFEDPQDYCSNQCKLI